MGGCITPGNEVGVMRMERRGVGLGTGDPRMIAVDPRGLRVGVMSAGVAVGTSGDGGASVSSSDIIIMFCVSRGE